MFAICVRQITIPRINYKPKLTSSTGPEALIPEWNFYVSILSTWAKFCPANQICVTKIKPRDATIPALESKIKTFMSIPDVWRVDAKTAEDNVAKSHSTANDITYLIRDAVYSFCVHSRVICEPWEVMPYESIKQDNTPSPQLSCVFVLLR